MFIVHVLHIYHTVSTSEVLTASGGSRETSQPAKVLTGGRRLAPSASRRPPVCLPFLRVTALLGTVTDFLTLTGNMLTLTFVESG